MESSIVQKNLSSYFDCLKKITSEVGLLHFKKSEVTPVARDLIAYLANQNLPKDIWDFNRLPSHIFVHQFDTQLLITISDNQMPLDDFSKKFAENKKTLTFKDLID